MALPNRFRLARMSDATLAVNIDDGMGQLEQALADILGVPIDTDIASKMFAVAASGLVGMVLQDLGSDPTPGVLARHGLKLQFNDAVRVLQLFIGSIIRKGTTEIRATGTTLADDAELLLPLAANELWLAEYWVYLQADIAANIKFTLRAPAGAAGIWGGFWADSGAIVDTASPLFDGTLVGVSQGLGNARIVHLWADITNGGTPGNLAFQWAQNAESAGVGASVLAGSVIKATRR